MHEGSEPLRFSAFFPDCVADAARGFGQGRARAATQLGAASVVSAELAAVSQKRLSLGAMPVVAAEEDPRRAVMTTVLSILALSWRSEGSTGAVGAALTSVLEEQQRQQQQHLRAVEAAGGKAWEAAEFRRRLDRDEGCGMTATWVLARGSLEKLDPLDEGHFHSDKTYAVLYMAVPVDDENISGDIDAPAPVNDDGGETGELAEALRDARGRLQRRRATGALEVVYLWRGDAAAPGDKTQWEVGLKRQLFGQIRDARGWDGEGPAPADPPVIAISERNEPPHFLKVFAGRLFHRLARASVPAAGAGQEAPAGALAEHPEDVEDAEAVRSRVERFERLLLQVRKGVAAEVGALSELCDSDVYLLLCTPRDVASSPPDAAAAAAAPKDRPAAVLWIWVGASSTPSAQEAASALAARLVDTFGLSGDEASVRIVLPAAGGDDDDLGDVSCDVWGKHRRGGPVAHSGAATAEAEAAFWAAAAGVAVSPPRRLAAAAPSSVAMGYVLDAVPGTRALAVRGVQLLQAHLTSDSILLLDGGVRGAPVFVWCGRRVGRARVQRAAMVARQWAEATASAAAARQQRSRASGGLARTYSFDPRAAAAAAAAARWEGDSDEDDAAREVLVVREGSEPAALVGLFHGFCAWDRFRRPRLADPWEQRVKSRGGHMALGRVVATDAGGDAGVGASGGGGGGVTTASADSGGRKPRGRARGDRRSVSRTRPTNRVRGRSRSLSTTRTERSGSF